MKRYYLAYGSNLNKGQMVHRCPMARVVGTAMMKNWRLLFRGSKTGSYLTIEEAEGYDTPVAVWAVTPLDERNLDIYEGYPRFYYKKNITVECNGEELDAFVYIMHEDRPVGIPSAQYWRTCREGYFYFDFNEEYLREAYLYSKRLRSA